MLWQLTRPPSPSSPSTWPSRSPPHLPIITFIRTVSTIFLQLPNETHPGCNASSSSLSSSSTSSTFRPFRSTRFCRSLNDFAPTPFTALYWSRTMGVETAFFLLLLRLSWSDPARGNGAACLFFALRPILVLQGQRVETSFLPGCFGIGSWYETGEEEHFPNFC